MSGRYFVILCTRVFPWTGNELVFLDSFNEEMAKKGAATVHVNRMNPVPSPDYLLYNAKKTVPTCVSGTNYTKRLKSWAHGDGRKAAIAEIVWDSEMLKKQSDNAIAAWQKELVKINDNKQEPADGDNR